MNFSNVIDSIIKKNFSPIYLLHGEEPFFIREILKEFEKNIISEENKSFDQKIFYGKDINVEDLICEAKSFPMLDNFKLILLKEAQDLKKIEKLESYINNVQEKTILVICYTGSKVRKNAKWYKALNNKNYTIFESDKLYFNQIHSWLKSYLLKEKLTSSSKVISLIIEHVGNDLDKIVNEIEKLKPQILGNKINELDVEKYIGISRKYNNFELQDRIANKNYKEALKIAIYLSKNSKENPFTLTIGMLYGFFSKLLIYHSLKDKSKSSISKSLKINPYFVQNYQIAASNYSFENCISKIHVIKEMDLKSKGVYPGYSDCSINEMIFRIIY